jgi:4-hydroxy-tetrahydrodipicolinate synthase
LYAAGYRPEAVALFRRLLPVVAFTNQEIRLSIAFFKALLVRRGIFKSVAMRWPGFAWDPWNWRVAEELMDLFMTLDSTIP